MPAMDRQTIAAQYENYTIYAIVSSRGALPGFHWGIFMPTSSPKGHIWHATNREGGWKMEHKTSDNVPFSVSLVLAYKINSINPSDLEACMDTLNGVDASGSPSPNTGEEFTCRVWVKDALTALHKNEIIVLNETIAEIEKNVLEDADDHKLKVETGKSAAQVRNS